MGSEFAQEAEWADGRSLDWWLLDQPAHYGVHALVKDLNRVYRRARRCGRWTTSPAGFEWIDANDAAGNTFSFLRFGEPDDDGAVPVVASITNFGGTPAPPVPRRPAARRRWNEILDTDAEAYGGSGVGNLGSVVGRGGAVARPALLGAGDPAGHSAAVWLEPAEPRRPRPSPRRSARSCPARVSVGSRLTRADQRARARPARTGSGTVATRPPGPSGPRRRRPPPAAPPAVRGTPAATGSSGGSSVSEGAAVVRGRRRHVVSEAPVGDTAAGVLPRPCHRARTRPRPDRSAPAPPQAARPRRSDHERPPRRHRRPSPPTWSTSPTWSPRTTPGEPDPDDLDQRVAFGTSGHRGSSLRHRVQRGAHPGDHPGDLRLPQAGRATTARCSSAATPTACPSRPGPPRSRCSPPTTSRCWSTTATATRPTPAVSHAILRANRGKRDDGPGLADGIVVTPSHNPPSDGGFKYNPPHGGPADTDATSVDRRRAPTPTSRPASTACGGCPFARARAAAASLRLPGHLRRRPAERRRPRPRSGGRRAHRRRPARRRERRLLGRDRRAARPRPDRGQPARRPDLAVHDAGLGRQDPDGLLVAVGDGLADRPQGRVRHRHRQRRRRRPARHRHPRRRADEPQPLPRRRDPATSTAAPGPSGRRRPRSARRWCPPR